MEIQFTTNANRGVLRMAVQRVSVELTDLSDQDNNQPTYDISDAVQINRQAGIESTLDDFKFRIDRQTLPNRTGTTQQLVPELEDGIKIWLGSTGTAPSGDNSNLIMDGKIDQIVMNHTEQGQRYSVNGVNRLEALLNIVFPTNFTNITAGSAVVSLVERANTLNSETGGGNPDWTNLVPNVASTTPTFDYVQPDKPLFQQIEELSSDRYTQDGRYIFFLSDDGSTFNWQAKPGGINTNPPLTPKEGTNIITHKTENKIFDVVNAVVIDAGEDFNGAGIKTAAYNLTSVGKMGFKWKRMPYTEISQELKAISGAGPGPGSPFGDSSKWTGGNDQFRADAKDVAEKWGTRVVNELGAPRWKSTVLRRGTTAYALGSQYELELPSVGWDAANKKDLRLTDITHSFNSSEGWVTELEFEQDEEIAITEFKEEDPLI